MHDVVLIGKLLYCILMIGKFNLRVYIAMCDWQNCVVRIIYNMH